MKNLKKVLVFILIIFSFIAVKASGSVTVSKNSISIDKGKTGKIVVSAKNVAGVIEISSLDTSIATVDKSNYFFDTTLNNSSVTITITGKKAGKATIRVKLKDIATFDGEELTGNKDITVTVKEEAPKQSSDSKKDNQSTSDSKKDNKSTSDNKSDNKKEEKKEIDVKRFEIVGYDITFNKNISEYSINVDKGVNKLYIIVEGNDFDATGDKEVDIKDKDYVTVLLSNSDEKKEYKININRIEEKVIEKEIVKENDGDNKAILYAMIFFEVLSIVLLWLLIKNKLKK